MISTFLRSHFRVIYFVCGDPSKTRTNNKNDKGSGGSIANIVTTSNIMNNSDSHTNITNNNENT